MHKKEFDGLYEMKIQNNDDSNHGTRLRSRNQKVLNARAQLSITNSHTIQTNQTKNDTPKSPRVAIAIPTHNRIGYVELCAEALNGTVPTEDIFVFDDASDEFSKEDLTDWFHVDPSHVMRFSTKMKADKMGRTILNWFVGDKSKHNYDWVVTLDSDLIIRPDWLELLKKALPKTQGVISVYHSRPHVTSKCTEDICAMRTLGNAGVTWSRELATRMLAAMPNEEEAFDWGWTTWLNNNKIKQYAMKESMALHIGMHGSWGAESMKEKTTRFDMTKLTKDHHIRSESFLRGDSPFKEQSMKKNR